MAASTLNICGFWLITALLLISEGVTQNVSKSDEVDDFLVYSPNPRCARDIDSQLHSLLLPFYKFIAAFLDVVQPQSISTLEDRLGKVFNKPDDFKETWTDNWDLWLLYFIGFVVCISIGLVLMIMIPVCGFIIACCRCKGKCGGRPKIMENKCSRYVQITCGVLLFIVTSCILIGVISIFVLNNTINERLQHDSQHKSDDNVGIWNEISGALEKLDTYLLHTVQDFDTEMQKRYGNVSSGIEKLLDDIPYHYSKDMEVLVERLNVEEHYNILMSLAGNIEKIYTVLINTTNSLRILDKERADLDRELGAIFLYTSDLLENCTSVSCNETLILAENVQMGENATRIDLGNMFTMIYDSMEYNLSERIEASKMKLGNISNLPITYEQSLHNASSLITHELTNLATSIEQFIEDIQSKNAVFNMSKSSKLVRSLNDRSNDEVRAIYWITIGITIPLCVIVFCGYLGLLLGAVCPRPSPVATTCSSDRTVASDALLTGIGITFIFYWIYVIIATVIFIGGGVTHTEICRHAVSIDNDSLDVLEMLDRVVKYSTNDSIGVDGYYPFYTYLTCENNSSFYKALNLASFGMDINNIINIERLELSINQMQNLTIDLPLFEIIDQSVVNITNMFDNAIDQVTFSSDTFYKENIDHIVNMYANLNELTESIVDTANNQTEDVNSNFTLSVLEAINATQAIHGQSVTDAIENTNGLLQSLELLLGNASFKNGTDMLIQDQDAITSSSFSVVRRIIKHASDTMLEKLKTYRDHVQSVTENELGNCAPVYESYSEIIDATCVRTLYPINGLWFAFGWCLFFLIPSIIISYILVDEYRKNHAYIDGIDHGFDDGSRTVYNAYGEPDYWTFCETPANGNQVRLKKMDDRNSKSNNIMDAVDPTATSTIPDESSSTGGMAAFDNPMYSNDEEFRIPRPTVIPTPYYPPTSAKRMKAPSPPPSYSASIQHTDADQFDDESIDTRL